MLSFFSVENLSSDSRPLDPVAACLGLAQLKETASKIIRYQLIIR